MADRRMFAKAIIDSDAFLDMPLSAQALYFHLSMRADDDGFVNNPKKIQRMIGASDDDCKLLIIKRFIITFESGVIVIKHWKIHNYIRNDRKKETNYTEEMALLTEKENGAYSLKSEIPLIDVEDTICLADKCQSNVSQMSVNCQSNVSQLSVKCQHRLGKDSIGKDSIGKDSIGKDSIEDTASPFDEFPTEVQDAIKSFMDMRKKQKKPMTDNAVKRLLKKLKQLSDNPDEQINILNQSEDACWLDIYPLKQDKQKKSSNNAGDNIFLQIAQEEGLL